LGNSGANLKGRVRNMDAKCCLECEMPFVSVSHVFQFFMETFCPHTPLPWRYECSAFSLFSEGSSGTLGFPGAFGALAPPPTNSVTGFL
jgi:hypothetical protein